MANVFDQFDAPKTEIVPDHGSIRPAQPISSIGALEDVAKSVAANQPALLSLSPVAICIALLLIRSAMITKRATSGYHLGVWLRLMIVLTIAWSLLVAGLFFVANVAPNLNDWPSILPIINLTYGPLVVLWLIYLAGRWIRQGAQKD